MSAITLLDCFKIIYFIIEFSYQLFELENQINHQNKTST